ncbi:MAG: hypothetical protein E7267_05805 [Lachnospiraceae bacterium]|nr:hypothetical protein [Lachnospiraceae bacterium]
MGTIKKTLALFFAAVLLITSVPADETQAARKPKLSKKRVSVDVGSKIKIKIKNAVKSAKVSWKIKNKSGSAMIVKKKSKGKKAYVQVMGVSAGKVKLVAKYKAPAKKKKLTCTITVREKAVTPTVQPPVNVTQAPPAEPDVTQNPTDAPMDTQEPTVPEETETPVAPEEPTQEPTKEPTKAPTKAPTPTPTKKPTASPKPTPVPDRDPAEVVLDKESVLIVGYTEAEVTLGSDGSASYENTAGFSGFMMPIPSQYILNNGDSFYITVDYTSTGCDARAYLVVNEVDEARSNILGPTASRLAGKMTATDDNVNYIYIKASAYNTKFTSLKINSITISNDASEAPTAAPTVKPTATPTPEPTAVPTVKPSPGPTYVPSDDDIWVATWGTAEEKCDINADRMPQMPLEGTTVRQIIKVTTSGNKMKLRLSNQYGRSPVTVRSLHIAKQVKADESTIDTSTDTVVRVNGSESFNIPAGQTIETDPVDFSVNALENVAISMYFGSAPTNNITGHRGARATTYQMSGNNVSTKTLSSYKTTTSWFFLADVSLVQPSNGRAVVCFGDSITDGYGTDADYLGKKPDSYTRWGDYFAKRLQANPATKNISVINEGIGSNSMMGSYPTDAGKDRFKRDLLDHEGVGYCIVLFGVNDLNKLYNTNKYNELKPEYEKMVKLAHENGIKIYAAPILPFGTSGYYSDASEQVRTMLNNWMRSSESGFDGIIDFESALADPANPKNIKYEYTKDDGLHPYEGYDVMANAIDLTMFENPGPIVKPTAAPTATPLPVGSGDEFAKVNSSMKLDNTTYTASSGAGRYDWDKDCVMINDASDQSQGAWDLPSGVSLKVGDLVTFRVQGYYFGTQSFRFWVGSAVSAGCTPVMLVKNVQAGSGIGSTGYPCVSNGATMNQLALNANASTGAFDVTFTFKLGESQNDTGGSYTHFTLKGQYGNYIDGLAIKNVYLTKVNDTTY